MENRIGERTYGIDGVLYVWTETEVSECVCLSPEKGENQAAPGTYVHLEVQFEKKK